MIRVLESLRLSSERKLEIVREIKEGSQPSGSFYVADYARRKGMTLQEAERWLAPNLAYDPEAEVQAASL